MVFHGHEGYGGEAVNEPPILHGNEVEGVVGGLIEVLEAAGRVDSPMAAAAIEAKAKGGDEDSGCEQRAEGEPLRAVLGVGQEFDVIGEDYGNGDEDEENPKCPAAASA